MLENQILIGILMIVISVVFHVTALVYLVQIITRMSKSASDGVMAPAMILSVSVIFIVLIHVIEAWVWALVYLALGEFSTLNQALYFSVVTATTLGYGDITLSEQWQLLSTFEAMGGMILFGVTIAFLFEIVRPVFDEEY